MQPARHVGGAFESTGPADSYIDLAGAYMDLDAGGTFAQFGAKGPGSIGLKLRTVLAGVALTFMTATAAGAVTFAENVSMSSGKTFAAQAVTATSIAATGGISITGASPGSLVATITANDATTTTDLLRFERFGGLVRGVLRFVNTNKFQFGSTTAHNLDVIVGDTVIGTWSPTGLTMSGALTFTTDTGITAGNAEIVRSSGGLSLNATSGAAISFRVNGTSYGSITSAVATFSGDLVSAGDQTFGGTQVRVNSSAAGGVQVGSPAGGFKGTGSINVSADIYRNDTIYNNPDYALEHWATGRIVRFQENEGAEGYLARGGRMSLPDLEAYVRREFHLPGVPLARGSFQRHDVLLEKVEELTTYIIEQHHEIESLKARLS